MKYLGVIQARCGSTRMPNKVLMDFAGKPSLQWTIERVQKSKYLEEVAVVTSINKENMGIVKLCSSLGVRVFTGSENDVLDRFYQFAKLIKPEYIVRITGDCPLYDPELLDWAIEHLEPGDDFLCQTQPETFPDGLDIEIIKYQALENAWKNANLKSDREHVTLYIRNRADEFRIRRVTCPLGNYGTERWTYDEASDYRFIKAIYDYFDSIGKQYPMTQEIIAFLEEHKELHEINGSIIRDEGLVKSLKNDSVIYAEED